MIFPQERKTDILQLHQQQQQHQHTSDTCDDYSFLVPKQTLGKHLVVDVYIARAHATHQSLRVAYLRRLIDLLWNLKGLK
jgi:hypothetical protein